MTKKIAIILQYLPHYRLEFLQRLKTKLEANGIDLILVYGQPGKKDAMKKDTVEAPWGIEIKNTYFRFFGRELVWQPIFKHIQEVDLIIITQASKLLVNYILLVKKRSKKYKIAFFGHGQNFQKETASPIGEYIKRYISTKADWWFAYTDKSAKIVSNLGFPSDRITVFQNAIDTREICQMRKDLSEQDIEKVRKKMGLKGNNVCLYVGGIYQEKRISFLLEACELIRSQIPDFEMIFIGSGADAHLLIDKSRIEPWLHYEGPKFEHEKVPYFALSKLFLMPGLVGLAILDCFAMELPMVTTENQNHSPEIDYLRNGENGIIVPETDDPNDYAREIIKLLGDENKRVKLVEGCRRSSKLYTIEEMVNRFYDGIVRACQG